MKLYPAIYNRKV